MTSRMKRVQEKEEEQAKITETKVGSSMPVRSRTDRHRFFGFPWKKSTHVVSAEEDRTGAGDTYNF